jgi:hypothetical protein
MAYWVLARFVSSALLSLSLLVVCLAEPKPLTTLEQVSPDPGKEDDHSLSPDLQPWLHQAPQANISGESLDDKSSGNQELRIDANLANPLAFEAAWERPASMKFPLETSGHRGPQPVASSRSRAP